LEELGSLNSVFAKVGNGKCAAGAQE